MKNGNMALMTMIDVRERQECGSLGARKCHVKVFYALHVSPVSEHMLIKGTQRAAIKNKQ